MVSVEMQKLMDAVDAFFEKKGVELESKFHITKLMSEQYWEEMVGDDDGLEGLDDDDFEPEEPEPEEPEEDEMTDEELDGVDEDFEDEVEDLEVPDTVPELEVPKPPSKAHEMGMKKKLQKKVGKLKKPKPKLKK